MSQPVIIDAVRTPFARRSGTFRDTRPDALLAHTLRGLLDRTRCDPNEIEDVVIGTVTQAGEQGANIGRLASLMAGLPVHVPALTLNRMCGSSQQAIHFAAQAIAAGDMDFVIAGGVESMTRVPMFSDIGGYEELNPQLRSRYDLIHQGESAERIAEKWGITRAECDEFAADSHRKAHEIGEKRKMKQEEPSRVGGEPNKLENLVAAHTAQRKLILKADFRGSIEAIRTELEKLNQEQVCVRILEAAIGAITESDVGLALSSGQDTLIVGFNVVPSERARALAEERGVEIRQYRVINNLTNDLRAHHWATGRHEIIPTPGLNAEGKSITLDHDDGVRAIVDTAKMASLPTIFRPRGNGVVTAANSSQISDGASGVLIADSDRARAAGLRPRARFRARVAVGDDPTLQLAGVIPATRRALDRAGLGLADIDWIEINEAFATVVLAWARELKPDMAKVNPWGGAIAHGHPLGATGAGLMAKMLAGLEATGGTLGLQVMCIGHGMATATIIERLV